MKFKFKKGHHLPQMKAHILTIDDEFDAVELGVFFDTCTSNVSRAIRELRDEKKVKYCRSIPSPCKQGGTARKIYRNIVKPHNIVVDHAAAAKMSHLFFTKKPPGFDCRN